MVVIGGGTGQSRVLGSLKNKIQNLSAIVTMADDGGSTGRLRRYQSAPPVGDIRQCLVALANPTNLWAKMFPYRFGHDRWGGRAQDIEGHTLGNIILVALVQELGGLESAIAAVAKQMGLSKNQGVFPSTFDNIILEAKLVTGESITGQFNISYNVAAKDKFRIERVSLLHQEGRAKIQANPRAVEQILKADWVIIGPGALHASILPNLLIPDIKASVAKTSAKKILIANTATTASLPETHGFTLQDHIRQLINHTTEGLIDLVLVNKTQTKYDDQVSLLMTDQPIIEGIPVKQADLISQSNPFSHDRVKLGRILIELIGSKD